MRRLFTLMSFLSLLLFAAMVVLWVRSFTRFETFWIGGNTVTLTLDSGEGRAAIQLTIWLDRDGIPTLRHTTLSARRVNFPSGFPPQIAAAGFELGIIGDAPGVRVLWLASPFWFVILCLTVPPVIELRRRLWRHSGCHVCGYNLTGNTSGTCPECGSKME